MWTELRAGRQAEHNAGAVLGSALHSQRHAGAADLRDVAPGSRLALAFAWDGDPDHSRLLAMAQAIMRFAAPAGQRDQTLFLMIDGDVGASLGRILHDEFHLAAGLVSIDGISLRELDFVDVGELLDPPGVVPVVIKSLIFPTSPVGVLA